MTEFWMAVTIVGLVLALLTLAFFAWVRQSQEAADGLDRWEAAKASAAIFKARELELQKSLAAEEISQATYDELLFEAKRQLLEDTEFVADPGSERVVETAVEPNSGGWMVWLCTGLAPLLALWLYLPAGMSLGASFDAHLVESLEKVTGAESSVEHKQALLSLIDTLEKEQRRVYREPQLALLLSRAYESVENYGAAVTVYRAALEENPEDATIMAWLAQSLHLVSGASENPEVPQLLEKALAIQPDNPVAHSLSGMRAFQAGDFRQAISHWQVSLSAYPPDGSQAQLIQNSIQAAHQRLGVDSEEITAAAPIEAPSLQLRIEIDPAQLNGNETAGTPVFVFARALSGPPMPLAARRLTLADLPADLSLGEADTMAGRRLEPGMQVMVFARLSRSGQPTGSAGDSEGIAGPVTVSGRTDKSASNDETKRTRILIDARRQ